MNAAQDAVTARRTFRTAFRADVNCPAVLRAINPHNDFIIDQFYDVGGKTAAEAVAAYNQN